MKRMLARLLSFAAVVSFVSCGETHDLEWVEIKGDYYNGKQVQRFWILESSIVSKDDAYSVYDGRKNPIDGEGFCSWIDSALPSADQLAYAASVAAPLKINTDAEQIAGEANNSSKSSFRCAYECREDGDCDGNRACKAYQCLLKCNAGEHDGGDGSCKPAGECAEGFHNGGDGNCMKKGYCSDGYHNGGDGICFAEGECSSEYHNDGTGKCVTGANASSGCATGYHDGGNGDCVANGKCSSGYHDDGTGQCVTGANASSGCATGYHNGGNGDCVATGQCSSGYTLGSNGVCIQTGVVSVSIPAGSFKSSASNTTVSVSAFKLAKTPTTVAQFKKCVDAGKCSSSNYYTSSNHSFCNYNRGSSWSNHPMNCVDWYGAKAFCEWVGGRLPSQDEWEYAATHNGSKALQTTYPWGNTAPTHCGHANYWDEGSDTTCNGRVPVSDANMVGTSAVGTYSPKGDSPLGLQDMAGNVFQWTSTWRTGESSSGYILQGSAWTYNEPVLQISAGSYLLDPSGWNNVDGFRCAFSQ